MAKCKNKDKEVDLDLCREYDDSISVGSDSRKDESSHKEKRHRSKKHRSNKQKSNERNTKKAKKCKKEKPKILIETKPIEKIIQNVLEQQENEQIELENKKMDEFIISDEEEDDNKQIVRRQEERALIFLKYQMETGLDDSTACTLYDYTLDSFYLLEITIMICSNYMCRLWENFQQNNYEDLL